MNFLKNKRTNKGYTIIETMIAISLFIVIIMAGMGTLLNANLLRNKSEDVRSIIDNLSFILEDMSRNLRTGYNYRCVDNGIFNNLDVPLSCASGGAIVFEEAHGDVGVTSDQWIYKVESNDGGITFNIWKSTDGGTSYVQLNTSDILINSVSGFSVLGAEEASGNQQQPLVNIRLAGKIKYKEVETPFDLQTSVSQRLIQLVP